MTFTKLKLYQIWTVFKPIKISKFEDYYWSPFLRILFSHHGPMTSNRKVIRGFSAYPTNTHLFCFCCLYRGRSFRHILSYFQLFDGIVFKHIITIMLDRAEIKILIILINSENIRLLWQILFIQMNYFDFSRKNSYCERLHQYFVLNTQLLS